MLEKESFTMTKEFFENRIARLRSLSVFEKILFAAIFSYIVVLSVLTSFKFYCFQSLAFDFGIFVQVFWNTLHGHFMFSQPRAGPLYAPSFLGVHFSPLVLILLPFYALIQSPYTLLVLQAIALALPALFIYKIAVRISGKETVALLFAIGYLVYPGTLWSNWYDFHVEAFVPLFLSMAFYYYLKGNKLGLVISMLMMLTTLESAVYIDLAFVVYIALREVLKRRKAQPDRNVIDKSLIIALLIVVSVSVIYYLASESIMNSVWPQRQVLAPLPLFGIQTFNNFLLKISYIAILTAPLAFLPFASPLELLPAAPYLFLALVTDYQPYFTVTWQYPALISVPFFVAAIFGLTQQNWKKIRSELIVAMMIFVVLLSPGSPLMSQFSVRWTIDLPSSEMGFRYQALSMIEENATVLAQENIFPNVAQRPVVYTVWPSNATPPDYIVIDVFDVLFYSGIGTSGSTKDALLSFAQTHNYGVAAIVNGFIILKKNFTGAANVLVPLHTSLELSQIRKKFVAFEDYVMETHFFVSDWVKIKENHLFLNKSISAVAWWGPYITVPPGKYRVDVRYSSDDTSAEPIMGITVYYWGSGPQYPNAIYAEKTVWSNETTNGRISITSFEFKLDDWSPALEVVGRNLGKANINVYSVEMQEIQ
jgi:uncharacterized membrane protein